MFDLVGNLGLGFATALSPTNLALCFLGCLVGTLIGVLPGVGPIATIAMLMPLTFKVDPTGALIMLAGIYYGAQYGGSTTAILVNIPGEATSVVTDARRARHGAKRPGRNRARDRGDRLVLRRHGGHAGHRGDRRAADQARAAVRPGRIFRPDGARSRACDRAGARLGAQGRHHGGVRTCCSPRSARISRPARNASPWG